MNRLLYIILAFLIISSCPSLEAMEYSGELREKESYPTPQRKVKLPEEKLNTDLSVLINSFSEGRIKEALCWLDSVTSNKPISTLSDLIPSKKVVGFLFENKELEKLADVSYKPKMLNLFFSIINGDFNSISKVDIEKIKDALIKIMEQDIIKAIELSRHLTRYRFDDER